MKEKYRKFMKVLRIELEDLEEDLRLMEELYQERERRNEITDYVLFENVSLLKREVSGIEHILGSMDDIDISSFASLDELADAVGAIFKRKTKEAAFPDAVYELVKRKLQKVARYVQWADE